MRITMERSNLFGTQYCDVLVTEGKTTKHIGSLFKHEDMRRWASNNGLEVACNGMNIEDVTLSEGKKEARELLKTRRFDELEEV